ncbi:hypothetical protein CDCA_CDCA08G2294 [Cyanidium caldarium]|uniref:Signal recognition particle 54 kDa protein n=1 Tax=Cyanidium caldarium TaxID=2771 RepID=A0AAV9IVV8_CYACA|nr:hypothetical protein CDCA_CDCA08G2294 [Cyanidium caldarium]
MVLEALGSRIAGALRSMSAKTVMDEETLDEALKEIARALLEADVNVKQVSLLRRNIKAAVRWSELPPGANKRRIVQKAVFDELCRMLDPGEPPLSPERQRANVVMFVGLQGNGKTTTCVKVAYYYKRRGYRTCLVCADTFRAGAFDQLRQNAAKVRVPFYGSYESTDAVQVARDGVEMFRQQAMEVIVVDTSGRHKQEAALFEEMAQLEAAVQPDHIVFVMDGSMGQAAYDQALAFRQRVRVGSVILTKMDGHARGGGALSAVAATHAPVVFLGTGEHMDELEAFRVESFVGRLLGMGDVQGLVKTITESNLQNPDEEQMQRLSQGVFTLRDMQLMYGNLTRLGPLSQVMSMMPGMAEMIPQGSDRETQARIQRIMVMLDSLTAAELDQTPSIKWDESRKRRIARGSGRSLAEVEEVLAQYRTVSKVWGRMGKNMKNMAHGMPAGGGGPGALGQQMQRLFNPRMMQSMGGAGNLQRMLQQAMASGGGGGASSRRP